MANPATLPDSLNQEAPQLLCPFCAKAYKGLGNHLSKCKERNGRDYSAYLSRKTLDKKTKTKRVRRSCPKCHNMFLRIDTHLSKNPFCKHNRSTEPTVQPDYQPNQQDQASSPQRPSIPTLSGEQVPPTYHYKPPIKLPTSDDEWEKTNIYFQEVLVPSVLQANNIEGKNHILVEGVYSYFEAQYGTHPSPNKQNKVKRKKPNHDRALKKVSKLKNLARKEYRQSRSNGLPKKIFKLLLGTFLTWSDNTAN